MLSNVGLIPNLIPEVHLFEDFPQCITALEAGKVEANPAKSEKINWKFVNF
jgi:hypothetical protein